MRNFTSKCQSPDGYQNANRAHAALSQDGPTSVERLMYEDVRNVRKVMDIHGPWDEKFTPIMEQLREQSQTRYREGLRLVALVVLTERGFRPASIAPVDYEPLIEALFAA